MTSDRLQADEEELAALLRPLRGKTTEERLDGLSERLLGRPYLVAPLGGSPDEPERLVSRIDGFDCVTYVESVLALARCEQPEQFEPLLRAYRYDEGRLDWTARNHYVCQWLERNASQGLLETVLPDRWTEDDEPRQLSVVPGLPLREVRLSYLPLERLDELTAVARTGDLVAFVSERSDLDVFHVGLLVAGRPPRLRHASRSERRVVEEELSAFLARNLTPGLLIARAKETAP